MIYYISQAYTLPSPVQFRQNIESQIWDDMITFVTISLGISLVVFMLSKIAN